MFGDRSTALPSNAARAIDTAQKKDAAYFFLSQRTATNCGFHTSYRFPHKLQCVQGDCDSNWLHVNAPDNSETICCKNEPRRLHRRSVLHWHGPHARAGISERGMGDPVVSISAQLRVYDAWAGRDHAPRSSVEKKLGHLVLGRSDQSCWYADLRRGKRCPIGFDHSDHIVLLVSHYMAILLFEWFALNVESVGPSLKCTMLRAWIVIVGGVATYLLFFTASYFHTTAENLVGLIIAQGCVMLPLMLVTQDYFTFCKWLRLHNFVLQPDHSKRDN
ncbi:unnamed protein product [Peronospora destructor]|uniref:Uncharacterized protein n=1 Tax=Peronospora destructor TaxID=86335 RepID=A0AAV0UPL7_9STRA|nr:unnamed protein product [Peronospora destructor]